MKTCKAVLALAIFGVFCGCASYTRLAYAPGANTEIQSIRSSLDRDAAGKIVTGVLRKEEESCWSEVHWKMGWMIRDNSWLTSAKQGASEAKAKYPNPCEAGLVGDALNVVSLSQFSQKHNWGIQIIKNTFPLDSIGFVAIDELSGANCQKVTVYFVGKKEGRGSWVAWIDGEPVLIPGAHGVCNPISVKFTDRKETFMFVAALEVLAPRLQAEPLKETDDAYTW